MCCLGKYVCRIQTCELTETYEFLQSSLIRDDFCIFISFLGFFYILLNNKLQMRREKNPSYAIFVLVFHCCPVHLSHTFPDLLLLFFLEKDC